MALIMKMFFAVLFSVFLSNLCVPIESAATVRREIQTEGNSDESTPTSTEKRVTYCDPYTPCGWAVFMPVTRAVKYFMKNTCDCTDNLTCFRVDEDLQISAYVYKCRPRRTTTSPPPDTE